MELGFDLSMGILMMGSTENGVEDEDGCPGKPCLRGAFAEMSILYVMRATEKVMRRT